MSLFKSEEMWRHCYFIVFYSSIEEMFYRMRVKVRILVFNSTFNNISLISCLSVLLVEENWVPRENHQPVASHWKFFSHNVVMSTPRHELYRIKSKRNNYNGCVTDINHYFTRDILVEIVKLIINDKILDRH
jgi:hypothetical protein